MKTIYDIICQNESIVDENIFGAESNLDARYLLDEFKKSYLIPRTFRYFYKAVLTKYMAPFKSIKGSQYFVIANFSIDYPDYLMSIQFIGPSINGGSGEYDHVTYTLFKNNVKQGSGVVGRQSDLDKKLSEAKNKRDAKVFVLPETIGERFWYDALNPWAKKR